MNDKPNQIPKQKSKYVFKGVKFSQFDGELQRRVERLVIRNKQEDDDVILKQTINLLDD